MISKVSNPTHTTETLYHLSHPQLRILFGEELYPNTSLQILLTSFVLEGDFEVPTLVKAIHLVSKT